VTGVKSGQRDEALPRGIQGAADPSFACTLRAFSRLFPGRRYGGGALAVYLHGEPVLDVWTGYADRRGTEFWTADTGYLARLFTPGAEPLTERASALAIIILAEVWKTTPFMALLLLAGLALVPDDLLKAAAMDGATGWQRFTKVILPIMKPAILVALLFRTLDAFRIFDNIFVLTSGAQQTSSVSILTYNNLIRGLNLGIGATMSVLIFVTVALIAWLFIKLFGTSAPGESEGRR